MNASARQIQDALESVAQLRLQHAGNASLASAVSHIKRFQARRFEASYADLLKSARYQKATAFFLRELYSEKDYSQRDQQFARIAETIARLFPQPVVNTALTMTQVHALTENLDDLMARQWLLTLKAEPLLDDCSRYVFCWRQVGDAQARQRQLDMVLQLGESLNRLTRLPGLKTMLKMMRAPAGLSGLGDLQRFLENGFEAFSEMRGADAFLALIQERESRLMQMLFVGDADDFKNELQSSKL